jgi:hypothetical protein
MPGLDHAISRCVNNHESTTKDKTGDAIAGFMDACESQS